jgi:hypothetical protein
MMRTPRGIAAIAIATLLAFNVGAVVWADESTAAQSVGTLGFGALFGYVLMRIAFWLDDRGERCERCKGVGAIARDPSSAMIGGVPNNRVCPDCFGRGRRVVELHRWN